MRATGIASKGTLSPRLSLLEGLESRLLFATIDVRNYGAKVNDGGDDTAAIRAAIAASSAGDTIKFVAGTYNISSQISVKSDRDYVGDQGAILSRGGQGADNNVMQTDFTTSRNVTFRGLTFDQNGLRINKSADGTPATNVNVIDCTFQNMNGQYPNNHMLFITNGWKDSNATGNVFKNIRGDTALLGFNLQNVTIQNNRFDNVYEGIHLHSFVANAKNVKVLNNYITNVTRVGIEIQEVDDHSYPGYDGLLVSGNYVSGWVNPFGSSFAYSIVPDTAVNTVISNNYASGPRAWPNGMVYGFEVAGRNTNVTGNRVDGGWVGAVLQTAPNSSINNNTFNGTQTPTEISGRSPNSSAYNNSINGSIPSAPTPPPAGIGASGSSAPGGTGGSTPAPTITAASVPNDGTFLSDLNPTSSNNAWGGYEKDKSNGEQGAGDGKTIIIGNTSYAKGLGVHANSEIKYALNGNYTAFRANVGIDYEVAQFGNVTFQVYADGALLYDSGTMVGGQAAKAIDVNVTGKNELRLVVNSNGSNEHDHADWGFARIVPKSGSTGGTSTPSGTTSASVPSDGTFLSDLSTTYSVNGWGSYEKDRSNGDQGSGDGKTLTLNGTTFAKGLGVHANSDLRYNLNGGYTAFRANVGLDAEAGAQASVVFQVWADGTKIYDSGTVTRGTATKNVDVDITGKKELRLVVTDSGNGNTDDHADWGFARIVGGSGGGGSPSIPSGSTYVSDLTPTSWSNGFGQFEKDRSNGDYGTGDGKTITLQGVTFNKGLGVHAGSTIKYALGGKYSEFNATVGVDDEVGSNGSVVFQVFADGVKLFDSGTMTGTSGNKDIDVSLVGKNELQLVVTDSGNGSTFDHADWGNALIVGGAVNIVAG